MVVLKQGYIWTPDSDSDFQVNKRAASEFKQRNMNDIFNRSLGGQVNLNTTAGVSQERNTEENYLAELDKIHRENLLEKRSLAGGEKKADVEPVSKLIKEGWSDKMEQVEMLVRPGR